jgi:hypothetical protein
VRQLYLVVALMSSLLAFASDASAQTGNDGNSLQRECSLVMQIMEQHQEVPALADNMSAGICLGLVHGVAAALGLWQGVDVGGTVDNTQLHGCMPDEVRTIELIKVVLKYLNDHPNNLHLDDTRLIEMAIVDAYPCKIRH